MTKWKVLFFHDEVFRKKCRGVAKTALGLTVKLTMGLDRRNKKPISKTGVRYLLIIIQLSGVNYTY